MGVHEVAANGFGSAAAAYEAARPGYPPSVIDWLIDGLSLVSDSVVVDLAAGTGKLTRLLAERGANPIAVEPVAAMRAELRKAAPNTPIIAGTAEALPFRRGSVDALTVAQAFHWFDNPTSHDQIARVIRPGGRLALLWNTRDRRVAWVDAIWSIMDRVERSSPWRGNKSTRFADEWELPGFTPFRRSRFVHDHHLTRAQMIERMASISHVAVLPDERKAAVLDEVAAIIDAHPRTRGRSTLTMTYQVDCHLAERLET